jgi:hypothetical protein
MRIPSKIVALFLLPVFLISSPAFGQQARIVSPAEMSLALAGKAAADNAQRDLVRRVLDRSDARAVAARLGLSVQQAESAVTVLSGAELNTLAQHAAAVESNTLAGGANTIVISLTTLLLILIIVILLAK